MELYRWFIVFRMLDYIGFYLLLIEVLELFF